jgi:hypothetical protein
MSFLYHQKTTIFNKLSAITFSTPPWSKRADDVIAIRVRPFHLLLNIASDCAFRIGFEFGEQVVVAF